MEEVENILNNGIKIILLFTPFTVTRFAMHRIYANRINLCLGLSVNFVRKKHLAECYQ